MNEPKTYEEAVRQLEDIVRKMEQGQLDIDQLGEQLTRAKALIKHCTARLTATEEQVNKILGED